MRLVLHLLSNAACYSTEEEEDGCEMINCK
jgi:hypothetical protein